MDSREQSLESFKAFCGEVAHLTTAQMMAELQNEYYIREYRVGDLGFDSAMELYQVMRGKWQRSKGDKGGLVWLENELRLFVWATVLMGKSVGCGVEGLGEKQWIRLGVLFPGKQRALLEYQAANLLKQHNQYKKWVHEEDRLFEGLVKRDGRLRWSELGKSLFIESGRKYFRTPKQCRERWLNHLDPSKLKKYWRPDEDLKLLNFVRHRGKRWARIAKELGGKRNEHSIKNRFRSLITKEAKRYNQILSESKLLEILSNRLQDSLSNKQNTSEPHFLSQRSQSICEIEELQPITSKQNQIQVTSIQKQAGSVVLFEELAAHAYEPFFSADSKIQLKERVFAMWGGTRVTKKEGGLNQGELEKQIRADLFLQADPFEMLRGIFNRAK